MTVVSSPLARGWREEAGRVILWSEYIAEVLSPGSEGCFDGGRDRRRGLGRLELPKRVVGNGNGDLVVHGRFPQLIILPLDPTHFPVHLDFLGFGNVTGDSHL